MALYFTQSFHNVCPQSESNRELSLTYRVTSYTILKNVDQSDLLLASVYMVLHVLLYGFFALLFYLAYLKQYNPIALNEKK